MQPMIPPNVLTLLHPMDFIALVMIFAGWFAVGVRIERPGAKRPSVTVIMMRYRRDWMRQMVSRQPRIFDAQALASLRQGTSFFASTCVIAVGGVVALIGNAERLQGVAENLGETGLSAFVWQLKLVPVAVFLTVSFLKFVWANRLFGYSLVVMASVPNDAEDPEALPRASQAAELSIRAAWNFNRGLRAMYFALAALAWLLGPVALILATAITLWVVWSREFMSRPRDILIGKV